MPPKKTQDILKVYESSLKRFYPLAMGGVGVCVLMVVMGFYGLKFVPAQLNEPLTRFVCGYLPMIVAGLILLCILVIATSYGGKRFTLRKEGVVYSKGSYQLAIKWRDLTLIRPNPIAKGMFLTALISDGKQFARIEKFFFRYFDELIDDLETERRAARSEHKV